MPMSNRERVGKLMDLLVEGLTPFAERELTTEFGESKWVQELNNYGVKPKGRNKKITWDAQSLLKVMKETWGRVFNKQLSQSHRSLLFELYDTRNRWAHQEAFTTDDAYRAYDSAFRLLEAVSSEKTAEVDRLKQELLRVRFDEQARRTTKRKAGPLVTGLPMEGLKSWRDVVTPHPDVASGKYQQAEFAADLAQVIRGEASSEYQNPTEFFRRTYLTEGLGKLLTGAIQRLAGETADPVVQLQTNFGGGKTHSMLALYHLCGKAEASDLPGLDPVFKAAGATLPEKIRRAVLVGTALSPAQPRSPAKNVTIHTLWGEMAWQLLGKKGYDLVKDADRSGVSPGSDTLAKLLKQAQPCLILIDEWVAFVRMLYGKDNLAAGSFDSNMTFAQALTEALSRAPKALMVAALPVSEIEVGGSAGHAALERLRDVIGRRDSPWRPASADEGFEIVRRRLFQDITDPEHHKARDAVVEAFSQMYAANRGDFPGHCREAGYRERLRLAYPIHPELFDRLYNDWSTLDTFQRTRGVLRLMAAVIHELWEGSDPNLLILPSSILMDKMAVQSEMTRYLADHWEPVITSDIDGANAVPLVLDRENPSFGRMSACRRVARTIYIGSAPRKGTENQGIDDRYIRLGCVQPGESTATFGDALRHLSGRSQFLYSDGQRYWYDTKPSLLRLARDRAESLSDEKVEEEIIRQTREGLRSRGDFARLQPFPDSTGDVPDEPEARLVVLGPQHPHHPKSKDSPARQQADSILASRDSSPRIYRNSLVFLAADKTRLAELEQAAREYLAWSSISAESEILNLDAYQANLAKGRKQESNQTVAQRIPETFHWLLVPHQADPKGSSGWKEMRLQGSDSLAVRASRKLAKDELLLPEFGGVRLRMELDKIPLWRGDHVLLDQMADDFAKYLYLPRLTDPREVIRRAAEDGLRRLTWEQDTFGYADAYDEKAGRYLGLMAGGQHVAVRIDKQCVLVKSEVVKAKLPDAAAPVGGDGTQPSVPGSTGGSGSGDTSPGPGPAPKPAKQPPKRFYGSVSLNPVRMGRDAGRIAEEVLQHMSSLPAATVEVTLEIQARIPDGVPDRVVRIVSENCRTLKFDSQEFEKE